MSDILEGLSHHTKMQRAEKEKEVRDKQNKSLYSLVWRRKSNPLRMDKKKERGDSCR